MTKRFVQTVDGWVDPDVRPATPGRGRPPTTDAAARRFAVATWVIQHQHTHGCRLKCAVFGAVGRFGLSRKGVFEALAEHRDKLPIASETYVDHRGHFDHRVCGPDGIWRTVPNPRMAWRPPELG